MEIKGFNDTIDWYDNNAETYSEGLAKAIPIDDVKAFLRYLPPHGYVLEAGCGPGRESTLFKENGIKTVGVDISKGLLEIARRNNPDIEYTEGNFLSLPFADDTFDGVWSHASLVHLEKIKDVRTALTEFARVLKSNGILYVYVKEQIGEEKTAVVADSLSNHNRFFRYYSVQELTDLITNTGFEILNTELKEDALGRAEVNWIEIIGKKVSYNETIDV
jgi:ubiquinone/menaquinone biosynthesis C-methylase UbiE